MSWQKTVFILLILFCLTPFGSPPVALALGLILAFTIGSPYPSLNGKPTKYLLQTSVVLLGFGMNLTEVYKAGRDGILFTIATIFGTLILGYFVGKLLSVPAKTSTLISSGTAICGGSAIAAVASVIKPKEHEISVALAVVFVLNAVGLVLFPVLGHAFGLSEPVFGRWAALAIHDTSSVVGAGMAYGSVALGIATTTKLARALWIVPITFAIAIGRKRTAAASLRDVRWPCSSLRSSWSPRCSPRSPRSHRCRIRSS